MTGPGAKDTRWSFVVKLPRKAQIELKKYGLDKGLELQDIGMEMVREWSERHGIQVTTEDDEAAGADDSEPQGKRPAA